MPGHMQRQLVRANPDHNKLEVTRTNFDTDDGLTAAEAEERLLKFDPGCDTVILVHEPSACAKAALEYTLPRLSRGGAANVDVVFTGDGDGGEGQGVEIYGVEAPRSEGQSLDQKLLDILNGYMDAYASSSTCSTWPPPPPRHNNNNNNNNDNIIDKNSNNNNNNNKPRPLRVVVLLEEGSGAFRGGGDTITGFYQLAKRMELAGQCAFRHDGPLTVVVKLIGGGEGEDGEDGDNAGGDEEGCEGGGVDYVFWYRLRRETGLWGVRGGGNGNRDGVGNGEIVEEGPEVVSLPFVTVFSAQDVASEECEERNECLFSQSDVWSAVGQGAPLGGLEGLVEDCEGRNGRNGWLLGLEEDGFSARSTMGENDRHTGLLQGGPRERDDVLGTWEMDDVLGTWDSD